MKSSKTSLMKMRMKSALWMQIERRVEGEQTQRKPDLQHRGCIIRTWKV